MKKSFKKPFNKTNYAFSIAQNLDFIVLKKVLALKDNMKYLGNELNTKLTLQSLKRTN